MLSIETRNKLTDYWADHGVEKGEEFAKLTNVIHEEWSGLSVKEHKNLKNLKTHNLRDHMSEAELIFTALAELSTRQIAETKSQRATTPMKRRRVKAVKFPAMHVSNWRHRPASESLVKGIICHQLSQIKINLYLTKSYA